MSAMFLVAGESEGGAGSAGESVERQEAQGEDEGERGHERERNTFPPGGEPRGGRGRADEEGTSERARESDKRSGKRGGGNFRCERWLRLRAL